MKADIHPEYRLTKFECACGAVLETRSTMKQDLLKIDVCNQCHPFYTGKHKVVDSGGRISKFNSKYSKGKS